MTDVMVRIKNTEALNFKSVVRLYYYIKELNKIFLVN